MALRKRLILFSGFIALISFFGLVKELVQWNEVKAYNQAVENNAFSEMENTIKSDRALFANAYAEHQKGHYQAARIIYSKLENSEEIALRKDVLFNMGNTYFQQALMLDSEMESDRAQPLIELAKTTYRKLLSVDPQHWNAKYNLERALHVLPDAEVFKSEKAIGARRAARTVISADTEDNLP